MKKVLCIIFTIMIFSGVIIASGLSVSVKQQNSNLSVKAASADISETQVESDQASNTIAEESVNEENNPDTIKPWTYYDEWVRLYRPIQDHQTIIRDLILNGADEEQLINVCIFWEDTDEPFSLVEEIWNQYPGEENMYKFWIEDAFNRITGKQEDAMNTDEVREYLNRGLTLSDINAANRFSRHKNQAIRDILEKRLSGESWESIILGANAVQAAALDNEANEYSGNDILDSVIIARNTQKSIFEVLVLTEQEEDSKTVFEAYANSDEAQQWESEDTER